MVLWHGNPRHTPNSCRHVVIWAVLLSLPASVWQCQSRGNPNRNKVNLLGLWVFLSHSGSVGSIWAGWVVCHPVLHGSVSSSREVSCSVCPNTLIHLLHSDHHTPLTRQEPIGNRGFQSLSLSLCLLLSLSLFFPSLSLVILTKAAVCFSVFFSFVSAFVRPDVPKNFTVKLVTKTTVLLAWRFSDSRFPYRCMVSETKSNPHSNSLEMSRLWKFRSEFLIFSV